MAETGFGLPTMGFFQKPVYDTLFPWMTFLPTMAADLAKSQYGDDAATRRSRIQADASVQGDQIRAGATTAAASIGANATIQSQQMQTRGMLQALQAQIQADAERYRNGDIAAGQRLQANLQQASDLANKDTALELAKMMGSGQLRDTIAARLALRGTGQMPGISSALNGMENRLWVNAPTVDMPPEYKIPTVNTDVGGGGGNMPSFSFGGGGSFSGGGGSSFSGGGSTGGSLGDLYGGLFDKLKGTVNFGNIFGYGGGTTPPVAPDKGVTTPLGGTTPSYAPQLQDMVSGKILGYQDGKPIYGAARGGKFKGEQAVMVGDHPSGKPTGVEELVIGKNFKVMPLHRAAFGHPLDPTDPMYDAEKRAQVTFTDPSITDPMYDAAKKATVAPPPLSKPNSGVLAPTDPMYNAEKTPTAFGGFPLTQSVGGGMFNAPDLGAGAPAETPEEKKKRIGDYMKRYRPNGPNMVQRSMSNLPSKSVTPPAETTTPPATPPAKPESGVTINIGGQPTKPLSDVNNIPALQQLRSGEALPAFGIGPTSLSEPSLGITDTPMPYQRSAVFSAMSPQEQEDALQMWTMLGIPREVALYQLAQSTPGFRMNRPQAFGF